MQDAQLSGRIEDIELKSISPPFNTLLTQIVENSILTDDEKKRFINNIMPLLSRDVVKDGIKRIQANRRKGSEETADRAKELYLKTITDTFEILAGTRQSEGPVTMREFQDAYFRQVGGADYLAKSLNPDASPKHLLKKSADMVLADDTRTLIVESAITSIKTGKTVEGILSEFIGDKSIYAQLALNETVTRFSEIWEKEKKKREEEKEKQEPKFTELAGAPIPVFEKERLIAMGDLKDIGLNENDPHVEGILTEIRDSPEFKILKQETPEYTPAKILATAIAARKAFERGMGEELDNAA